LGTCVEGKNDKGGVSVSASKSLQGLQAISIYNKEKKSRLQSKADFFFIVTFLFASFMASIL